MVQIYPGKQPLSSDQDEAGSRPASQPARSQLGPLIMSSPVPAKRQNFMFQVAEGLLVYLSSGDLDSSPSLMGCTPGIHQA